MPTTLKDRIINVSFANLKNFAYFQATFTQERTLHILRFYLDYTGIVPAAPQVTVVEAGNVRYLKLLRCSLV
jgi:hypothetical protein